MFGGEPATHAGFAFDDLAMKIVFASDCSKGVRSEKGNEDRRRNACIVNAKAWTCRKPTRKISGTAISEAITGVKFKS